MSKSIVINILRRISKSNLKRSDEIILSGFVKQRNSLQLLINLAQAHGVAGLLFHHLKNLKLTDCLSESDISSLENIYANTAGNSLSMMAKALEISQLSKNAQIKIMVLQGLSVIRLYKNPGLRPMCDIDLMVSSSEKDIFFQHLCDAGYIPVPAYPDLLTKNGFFLDIHTHVLNLDRIEARKYIFPKDMNPMWENAVPFFEHDDYLLCLNPYDNFIALCAHALKHSYSRIIWLTDLYELLTVLCRKDNNAWKTLTARAHFWKQEKIVLYSLMLIENIFSFNIPLKVKHDLGICDLGFIEKLIINLLLSGFSSNELCIILWLCNIKGMSRKFRFLRETVFPEKKIMAQIAARDLGNLNFRDYLKRIFNTCILIWINISEALKLIVNTGQGFFIYK